ncbi:hypothetical protein QLQ12_16105 [Actinoplanes sp. NEAU-A12]|uniref:Cardiolipin synthase N-terminal domain-containing protein n=1 Tax=Actinoplanes sandaracinus TaxID=3045177 RepID=A0ABT6WK57_9ACTN|nr:hypothetical protein [Actinoplanes sandaracinus]MDI6100127.1 hypothetical protein [Actinoplanes sandaracinus]
MTIPGQPDPSQQPETSEPEVRMGRYARRRERVYRQIERDRAGGHKIPTWVLALILVLFLGGWLYLILGT